LYINPLAPPDTADWQPGVTSWPYPSLSNSVWVNNFVRSLYRIPHNFGLAGGTAQKLTRPTP
jgi:hypothetical protein